MRSRCARCTLGAPPRTSVRHSGTVTDWRVVARVGDVRAGDIIPIDLGGVAIVLGRDGERYFATQRHCVHRGGDLVEGIISRGHLICPNHGWRFSTATGCHAEASEYCLVTYAVRVVGEDIEIELEPRPKERTAP